MQGSLFESATIRPPGDPECLDLRAATMASKTERDIRIFLERETRSMESEGWKYWLCRDTCVGQRLGAESPDVLLVQGIPDLSFPRVAIIGPRRPDDYGTEVANLFAAALGKVGITVVSGGAAGIDTEAHVACLEAGGNTFCVLGGGFEMPFPAENAPMFARLGRPDGYRGSCLISEYSPAMPSGPYRFPRRNRLVAALSDAVIVIQAAWGSGAMITAGLAIDMGVPVFAVPADIHWKDSCASNDLLGRGALAICRPGDLEVVPGLSGCGLAGFNKKAVSRPHGLKSPWQRQKERTPRAGSGISSAAARLLDEIRQIHAETGYGAQPDMLAGRSGISAQMIQSGLLELELAGLVERLPGGVALPAPQGTFMNGKAPAE